MVVTLAKRAYNQHVAVPDEPQLQIKQLLGEEVNLVGVLRYQLVPVLKSRLRKQIVPNKKLKVARIREPKLLVDQTVTAACVLRGAA